MTSWRVNLFSQTDSAHVAENISTVWLFTARIAESLSLSWRHVQCHPPGVKPLLGTKYFVKDMMISANHHLKCRWVIEWKVIINFTQSPHSGSQCLLLWAWTSIICPPAHFCFTKPWRKIPTLHQFPICPLETSQKQVYYIITSC